MPSLSTPAIILATFRYGESSKILRLVTEAAGVQSAIAKGALRPKSRFGASLQVLSEGHAHLIIHHNRELQLLTAFDLHRVRVGLARDMERYSSASALAEVMLRFGSGEGHLESYHVLRSGIDDLENAQLEQVASLGVRAIWRMVNSLGFEPALDQCVKCGSGLEEDELAFDPTQGGALCPSCARGAAPARLSPGDRADLLALVQSDQELPRLSAKQAAAHRRLLARYIQYHLGEGTALPAIDFWIRRPWEAA
jgi:DNA repair protein RecO (recombination protein O)